MDEERVHESVFDKLREHEARDLLDEQLKFRWRYTTLRHDYEDLKQIHKLEIPHSTERAQQLATQDYVFEVERRLHHYLSGLYTLLQQQNTLQEGVGEEFRGSLQDVKNEYMGKESSRTVLGLRHYIQHENVLPLQARVSKLEDSKSLVVMLDDLHRIDGDRDFAQHFGHINRPYLNPVEWAMQNWPDVEQFVEESIEVLNDHSEDTLQEFEKMNEEVDRIYSEVESELQQN